jgi:hypothetical protein
VAGEDLCVLGAGASSLEPFAIVLADGLRQAMRHNLVGHVVSFFYTYARLQMTRLDKGLNLWVEVSTGSEAQSNIWKLPISWGKDNHVPSSVRLTGMLSFTVQLNLQTAL